MDPLDVFCVCPACRSFEVRIGDACRACRNGHLRRVDLLHHYRCAWVAPEADFARGHEYVCPKCRKTLNHVGVDYDRTGRFYLCSACLGRYPEDGLRARCDACRRTFLADELPLETVRASTLPLQGAR